MPSGDAGKRSLEIGFCLVVDHMIDSDLLEEGTLFRPAR